MMVLILSLYPPFLGVKKRDAQVYFIQTVYELESYGVTYVKAVLGKEDIILGIGAKYVRIYKNDRRLIYRYIHYCNATLLCE